MKKFLILLLCGLFLSAGFYALARDNSNGTTSLESEKENHDSEDIPAATGETDEETPDDTEINAVTSDDTLRFIMNVRWGNVQGEVKDKSRTDFTGSITASSDGKLRLVRTLLFEQHGTSTADSITSKQNPVSWDSLIFGHWDGVKVLVYAKANEQITINTTQGGVSKTAKELFEAKEPIVEDLGSGREIVIKSHPFKHRHYFLKLVWGKTGNADSEISRHNFSGSINLNSGGKIKLMRTIRFENGWRCKRASILNKEAERNCANIRNRDRILEHSKDKISWRSIIAGGIDGILIRVNLARNVGENDTLTLKFPELNYEKSFSLLELYHDQTTEDSINVNGGGYGVILDVWKRPNKSLIRQKGRPAVFMIEDDEKRVIPSADIFKENGLEWEDIEEVTEDEVSSYADGEPVCYPDGTLIKGSRPVVYVMSEGRKRPIMSANAFNKLGYKWERVKQIPDDHLNLCEDGDAVDENSDYPDGTLLKLPGQPQIWVIEGKRKKHISSAEVFNERKFKWNEIVETNEEHLNRFDKGEDLSYPDGSLVLGPDGKVFRIDGNKKRWVKSALDFEKNGFRWEKIKKVEARELNEFEDGHDIIGDDLD